MDSNLVYSRYRDDAFAELMEAEEYRVFVAMPFREQFSYRSRSVLKQVICAAQEQANVELAKELGSCGDRRIGKPQRIDDVASTAIFIPDEIISTILRSHVVVADLTFANDGVLIEAGAALALMPTQQIIFITQGDQKDLHFDIKGNNSIRYGPRRKGINEVAKEMVSAVTHFEDRRQGYLSRLSERLPGDATLLMNWYGRLRTGAALGNVGEMTRDNGMLVYGHGIPLQQKAQFAARSHAMARFDLAIRDLMSRDLMRAHYIRDKKRRGDFCIYRCTKLGWRFIEYKWGGEIKPPRGDFDDLPLIIE